MSSFNFNTKAQTSFPVALATPTTPVTLVTSQSTISSSPSAPVEGNRVVELGATVSVTVAILFTLLTFVFVYYAAGVLRSAVQKELAEQIHHSLSHLEINPSAASAPSREILDRLNKLFSVEDPAIKLSNMWLFRTMFIVSGLLMTFAIIVLICSVKKIKVGHLIGENLLIFFFVGIVELMFFQYVATKYIPTPPSFVTTVVLDELKNALNYN